MNWWLSLYTIPSLKRLALPIGLVFIAHLVLAIFSPENMFLAFYANGFIWWAHHKNRLMSFAANIEFHKMHVPFSELRPALFKDISIKAGVLIFVFLTNFFIALNFVSEMEHIPYQVLGVLFLLSAFSEFFVYSSAVAQGKVPRYRLMGPEVSFFKRLLIAVLVGVFSLFLFLFFIFNSMNPFYLMGLLCASLLLAHSLFWYRAIFHQEMANGKAKTYLKYNGLGFVGMSLIYIFMAFGSAPFVNNDWIPPTVRLISLQMTGEFGPKLDITTARDLLAVTDATIPFGESLILTLTDGAGGVPMKYFYPRTSASNLLSFIRYTKPSRENRIFALKVLRTGKLDKYYSESLTRELAAKWPAHEKVPDELVAVKLRAQNLPGNSRIPASK